MKRIVTALAFAVFGSTSMAGQWQALPEKAPAPKDNPTTAAKVELGKMLFMDPRFSSTGTVSCNSCHNVMAGGEDNRPVSMGVHGKTGGRSAPTVWNSAFHATQFWDGRAASLEEQAKGPVANPIEMGMKSVETAMDRVRAIPGYRAYFVKAFGKKNPMTVDNAAKAVAAFERTLITPNSAYDKYVKGSKKALNKQQQRGMKKFAEAGCASRHSGAAFNGQDVAANRTSFMRFPTFANNKYTKQYKLNADKGRQDVTKKTADANMFRVPTLRNIAMTAPYFHNGAVATLDEAVRVMARTQLNKDLSKKDVADIAAFLNALTGEFPEITMPRLPATPGKTIVGMQQ
ncbi:MAG: cytochrome-c peroxidase [Proteobacteria bacterium]|nr:cytochrome-c peroxidase [Pseudomonadota bacterium]